VKLTLAAPTRKLAERCAADAPADVGTAIAANASATVTSETFTALRLLTDRNLDLIASACTGV
jgi:hypothetical protein